MTRPNLTFLQLARFLIVFLLLTAFTSTAQPPDTLWTRSWDFDEEDVGESVKATRDGGYILGGWSNPPAPGEDLNGILVRTDGDGNEIWHLNTVMDGTESVHSVTQTPDGGFAVCGGSPNFTQDGSYAAFVIKLDPDGNILWTRWANWPNLTNWASCVQVATNGDLLVYGYGPYFRPFVWRLTESGQERWRQVYHPWNVFSEYYFPRFLEATADNGCVFVSTYWPGDQPDNEPRAGIVKVDQAGNIEWFSGNEPVDAEPYCVRQLPDGAFLVAGLQTVLPDYIPTRMLTRYEANGDLSWVRVYNNLELHSIIACAVQSPEGMLYCGGSVYDINLGHQRWLSKIDPTNGDIIWDSIFQPGRLLSLTVSRDGGLAYTGWDQTPTNLIESEDLLLVKHEPEIEVQLQAWTPAIPAEGGWLRYGAQVTNILVEPTPLDAWIVVTGPNGQRTPLNSFPVTLQPGATFNRYRINVWIPAAAPNGEYTLEAHLGVAPPEIPPGGPGGSRTMGLGSFTFTKGQ